MRHTSLAKLAADVGVDGPRDGDVVVGCVHAHPAAAHFYLLARRTDDDAGLAFQREDGAWYTARWLCLCDGCHAAHGGKRLHDALAVGAIPLARDLTWPARAWRQRADEDEVTETRADTESALRAMTPPGWARRLVRPPWHVSREDRGPDYEPGPASCRVCGATKATHPDRQWGVATLTYRDTAARTLLFSFAVVCDACYGDPVAGATLSGRVFDQPTVH